MINRIKLSTRIILLGSIITLIFSIFILFLIFRLHLFNGKFNISDIFGILVTLGLVIIGSIILSYYMAISASKPINSTTAIIGEETFQISYAAEQLANSGHQLADSNSELAASIEETSASLEQSSSMINQNSQNTKEAAILAAMTREASDKANNEMQEMLISIDEIKKSSDEISKIIKVIDEIAFQTNILALNAAVEAARAGDAGMGFSVVSEEVRNLAQKSASAAKSISSIIEKNLESSQKGVETAKKVNESLFNISNHAIKVNELVDEVAHASLEQSIGISEINKAISLLENVINKNALNSHEIEDASVKLGSQAENLKSAVENISGLTMKMDKMKSLSEIKQIILKNQNKWKNEIIKLSKNQSVKSMNFDLIKPFVLKEMANLKHFEMFFIAYKNGDAPNTFGVKANIADREYFQRAINGETVVSEMVMSRGSGKPIVSVATPVKDNSGKIIGVFGNTILLTEFNNSK